MKVVGETLQLLGGRDAGQSSGRAADEPLSADEAIDAAEDTPF